MKKYRYILACILVMSVSTTFAQDSKEDKAAQKALEKEWKAKMKKLTPMDYKALVEEKNELASAKSELESANADLQSQVANLESEKAAAQQEADDCKAAAAEAEAAAQNPPEGQGGGDDYDSYKQADMSGIVFKVQVGAFRNFDMKKYFDNHKNFSGEVDPDGNMKYTLGVFKEYWEADKFKKYLRDMGVKGAWVVSYKDGQRVSIKDALEGVLN